MATKTRRIEMRTDPASEERIVQAAQVARQTVSAFVLESASSAADRVLARAHHVVMPEDQFDQLMAALDGPDSAPRLEQAALKKRRFTRR